MCGRPRSATLPLDGRLEGRNGLCAILHGLVGACDDVLLLLRVVHAHELSGVTYVVVRVDFAVDDMTHHVQVILRTIHR